MAPEHDDVPDREERLSAILVACLEAIDRGEMRGREEFRARYPEFADEVNQFLDDQERVARCAAPLRAVAAVVARGAREGKDSSDTVAEVVHAERTGALRRLGDYELLEEIGRGGMATVYRARQGGLGRTVAIKVIRAADGASRRDAERFRREAELAAHLDHPHIVPVHEVGEQDGYVYFSMKLIEGGSLAVCLDRFTADPRAAARLVAAVARAVHHAHQRGVLHRDLKPANILLDEAGQPHVTDFGLARRVEGDSSLTQSGTLVGTPSYMAPEQTAGERAAVTTAADVYGLGALLYALLTGRPPFLSDTPVDTMLLVREREPEPPRRRNDRVDRDLETICLKCLTKAPAKHYVSGEALAEDLERWLHHEPVRARRTSRLSRLMKWTRRRPAIAGLTLALAVSALLGTLSAFSWALVSRQADQALSEALVLKSRGKWSEAIASAERAEALLTPWPAREQLHRARALAADYRLAERLEKVRLDSAEVKNGRFDHEARDAGYADIFRSAGLDIQALDGKSAADRIRATSVSQEVGAALDDWAMTRKRSHTLHSDPRWQQLLHVAAAADPDPGRVGLREALAQGESKTLKALALSGQIDKWPPSTVVLLGKALLNVGEPKSAESVLRRALHRHPDDFWLNELLAQCFFAATPRRWSEAEPYLEACVALRPDNPGMRLNLANALSHHGLLAEAIAENREATRLKPDYVEAHMNLGMLLLGARHVEEAVAEEREALRLKPAYIPALAILGDALEQKGLHKQAIDCYREAIRHKADSTDDVTAELYGRLGSALFAARRTDDAIAAFHEAIRMQPDLAEAYLHLGMAYLQQKKLDEAITAERQAIRLKPSLSFADLNLGIALAAKGQRDNAIAAYQHAVHIRPDFAEAHRRLGVEYIEQGKLEEGIAEERLAIRLKPDLALAYCNLGAALFQKGLYQEAADAFRQSTRLEPNMAALWSNLAIALERSGKREEAKAAYRQAERLTPKRAAGHGDD